MGHLGRTQKSQAASEKKLKAYACELEQKLEASTRELAEALEQQTATSEVLRVISSSPGDLQPVFEAMLANATRICAANFGNLYLRDGEDFHLVAHHNTPAALVEERKRTPYRPAPKTAFGRMATTKQVVHVAGTASLTTYAERDPRTVAAVELGGIRTLLMVPMLKENELTGALAIYRQEVRPFTDKQIEFVTSFANQAVIAIENTRLLNELQQRTADLSEALDQQTATSEVLRVISSSPGELKPVFDAMLANATHICGAEFGLLQLEDGELSRIAAVYNVPPALAATQNVPFRIHPKSGHAEIRRTKKVVQIDDIRAMPPYLEGDPRLVALADLAGARTMFGVPMLKEGTLVGTVSIYRQEVRPFTAKQIELVTNFARQAVIAIENTRLLNELRESLQQQTATADVLKVISSSPGALMPVFDAMLQNAVSICEARFGTMFRFDGDVAYVVAMLNLPPALDEHLRQRGRRQPAPGSDLEKVLKLKQVIHTIDSLETPHPSARLAGARTCITVPMLKETELVGAIVIYRQDVRPFTDKQIELVTNFAAQAVIAIENTRLLNELRESLQQQTATSEVLQVISSSPGELKPVFEAMLENATRLCEASYGTLWLCQDDGYRAAAIHGDLPAPFVEQWLNGSIYRPAADVTLAQAMLARKPVQEADLRNSPQYRSRQPLSVSAVEIAGIRSLVVVPMLNDNEPVGAIAIYRKDVQPFGEKQIELVENFAAQAVIAIENTRLLNE